MPLSPAPILPGGSPLPPAGQRPPDRRALRIAALVTLPLLIVVLAAGQLFMTQVVFFTPGLQAQANTRGGGGRAPLRGVVYPWTRRGTPAPPGRSSTPPPPPRQMRH